MNISLQRYYDTLSKNYKSKSQLARVVSERWCMENLYCPYCSNISISSYGNNKKVYDFFCDRCGENYQLKAKSCTIGTLIVDGEYHTMMKAINGGTTPNFLLMAYVVGFQSIKHLSLLPKNMVFPNNIIKRKPLSASARRAGWTGCNINIGGVCSDGIIKIIDNGNIMDIATVRERTSTNKALFSEDHMIGSWLNDIKVVVDKQAEAFRLNDIYAHISFFKKKHPENKNIEAKIRQQLQLLRDKGILSFLGKGQYSKKQND